MERRNNHEFNEYRGAPIRGRGGRRGRGREKERGGRRQIGRKGRRPLWGRRPMRGARGRDFESRKIVKIHNLYNQEKIVLSISYEILKELINKDENEIIQILSKYKDSSEIFENNVNFIKEMTEIMVELLVK